MIGPILSGIRQSQVNKSQAQFTKEVVDATKSGQINKEEFMALTTYDQKTRELEGRFLKDGQLSAAEKRVLDERMQHSRSMLNLYKYGDFHPAQQAPRNAIEARMQNQLSRTYDGIVDGSLTRGEAVRTLNYQGETATLYGKYQATPNKLSDILMGRGTFTPGEQAAIHRRLDNSSRQLYHLRHNWASDWGAPREVFRPPLPQPLPPSYPPYQPPIGFPGGIGGEFPLPPMFPFGGGYPQIGFPVMPPFLSPLSQGLFGGGIGIGVMGGFGFGGGIGMGMGVGGFGFGGGMMVGGAFAMFNVGASMPLNMGGGVGLMQQKDQNTIITRGGYEIKYQGTDVIMKDPRTGKWTKVWGDPHVKTSDGDSFDWKTHRATFVLPDGTKVTMNAENKDGVVKGLTVTDGFSTVQASGGSFANSQVVHNPFYSAYTDATTADGNIYSFKPTWWGGANLDDVIAWGPSGPRELRGNLGENYEMPTFWNT